MKFPRMPIKIKTTNINQMPSNPILPDKTYQDQLS